MTIDEGDALGKTVLYSLEDGIARITLNKPDEANAISSDQRNTIIDLLMRADWDNDVRVVVLASNGKHFCGGADVRGISGGAGGKRRAGTSSKTFMYGVQRLIGTILDCGKPVVAAVQGAAVGLGAHIVYASDIVIASENAYFQEPFTARGIGLDAAGAYLLPRRVGLQKAKELVFFAEKISATDAEALGLVNRVVPPDEFEAVVNDYATRLANAATLAITNSKRLLNLSLDSGRAASFLQEAFSQEVVSSSEDTVEGVKAFMEKRGPKFKGY